MSTSTDPQIAIDAAVTQPKYEPQAAHAAPTLDPAKTLTPRHEYGPQHGRSATSRRGSLLRTMGLLLVAALSIGVVGYAIAVYGGFDPARSVLSLQNTTWHYALLQAHIITGGIALGLGPLQFFRRIRSKHPRVHRWIGRTYLFAGVFPSATIGIPVALLSVEGAWASAGLLLGDAAWLITGIVAYRAARQRRFADHAKWMTWNFALTFAAVTFRIWLGLLIAVQVPLLRAWYGGDFGALFTVAYSATTFLAFLPNVAVVVLAQRIARGRRSARTQIHRDGVGAGSGSGG